MKFVAYLRVSSNAQAERDTIAQQRADVAGWAKTHGHTIVRFCEDEAVSGKLDAEARPGLRCVLHALDSGVAQGVVFKDLDRLARSVTVQEATLGHFWRHNARVWVYVGNAEVTQDDPNDPMRTAMRQMSAVFNQLEAGLIRLRMEQGREAKRADGGYVEGAPPYGMHAVDRELVEHPEEQAVIRRVLALRAEGMSIRAIARQLNDDGIPPKRARTDRDRQAHWHPTTVARLLHRAARAAEPSSRDRPPLLAGDTRT